jgi:hypothetical protein
MSEIKKMRAALWSEEARVFLARFERTVHAEAAGEIKRIEEAEEDDAEWAFQKARAKLEHDPERKLLGLAREVAVAAERLATCKSDLSKFSTDTARNARKDIAEAIEHLQAFEKLLADKSVNSSDRVLDSSRFVVVLAPLQTSPFASSATVDDWREALVEFGDRPTWWGRFCPSRKTRGEINDRRTRLHFLLGV